MFQGTLICSNLGTHVSISHRKIADLEHMQLGKLVTWWIGKLVAWRIGKLSHPDTASNRQIVELVSIWSINQFTHVPIVFDSNSPIYLFDLIPTDQFLYKPCHQCLCHSGHIDMYTPWYHVTLIPINLEFKFHWNRFTHSYIYLDFKFTWYQSGLVYCWLEFKLRWYQSTNLPRHQFTKVYWWFLLDGLDPIQSIICDLWNGGLWEPSRLHPPCPDPPFDDSGSSHPCSNIYWYQAVSKHGKLETNLPWYQAQLVPRRLETLGPIYQGANVPIILGTNFDWYQVRLVPIHPCTNLPAKHCYL